MFDLDEAMRRSAVHYFNVLQGLSDSYERGEDLDSTIAEFRLEWGQIREGQAWSASRLRDDAGAAALCNGYAGVGIQLVDLNQSVAEVIRWLRPALRAARLLGHREGEGIHLTHLGVVHLHRGRYRPAIRLFQKALGISRELNNTASVLTDYGNLGIANLNLGNYREAISYFERAIALSRELKDRRSEAVWSGNLGNALSDQGEYRRAIEHYERAVALSRECGHKVNEGNHLGNLGNAYLQLGNYGRAVELHKQART